MVALPILWGGDFGCVARDTYGEELSLDAPEEARIGRLIRIADKILRFAKLHRCDHVAIEQYTFRKSEAHVRAIGELGGVVRHQLVTKLGLVPVIVQAPTARKLVLGKVPQSDVKAATRAALARFGMSQNWTEDEADAFVVANYEAHRAGECAIGVAPVETKRSRRKAA